MQPLPHDLASLLTLVSRGFLPSHYQTLGQSFCDTCTAHPPSFDPLISDLTTSSQHLHAYAVS